MLLLHSVFAEISIKAYLRLFATTRHSKIIF